MRIAPLNSSRVRICEFLAVGFSPASGFRPPLFWCRVEQLLIATHEQAAVEAGAEPVQSLRAQLRVHGEVMPLLRPVPIPDSRQASKRRTYIEESS